MNVLDGLDDQQRAVATSLDAPVCVLAGAGTGKTRSITHRIAYGVHEGAYLPEQVLALTFTSKAAAEMAHRLRDLGVSGVAARTFHSAALRQLQHFWPTVTGGRLPDIVATKAPLIAKALESLRIDVNSAVLRDLAGDIEWRKVHGYTMAEYLQFRPERGGTLPGLLSVEVMADIHERYEQVKDEQNRIDFEDVLLATQGMLETEKRVIDQVRAQYSVFVVDEYQDVSPLQQRLLETWVGPREDLVVVGDVSQTIYSFAGASSSYLLDFPQRFPNAHIIKLETNYRSGEHIVRAANHVMAGRPGALNLVPHQQEGTPLERHAATDDAAEARYVAQTAKTLIDSGVAPDDIALLMRFGAQSLALENALREHNVSHRVQGATAFFDEPHVKRAVMEIRGAAVAGVSGELVRVVDDILFGLGLGSVEPDHGGAERSRYEDLIALRELALDVAQGMTLVEFSDMLQRRLETGDSPSVGAITLSTVHAAKGQEWPVVFMVGLAEGQFPISYAKTDEAVEEERRLFYVGITRAREKLYLSFAQKGRDAHAPREPSRFLRALSDASGTL
jgi:DNA helicase-2/ATP-dependent DNA helicase PcrA